MCGAIPQKKSVCSVTAKFSWFTQNLKDGLLRLKLKDR